MRVVVSFIKILAVSRWSLFGAGLVTSAILADVILILGELFVFESHPYIGIFAYFLFPSLALLGLLLIPVGILWRVLTFGRGFTPEAISRLIESRRINYLHVLQMIFLLSLVNLVVFGILGYRGFHFTESREFCGELCHSVMHPELTVYSRSPHSEISCVECHIGPGAGWFVKSKLSGARQLLAVMTGNYSRPIETPIHNLRPAREVCEVCHRPEIFHGNRIKVIQHFQTDKENTRSYTILNLRVGSGGEHGREAHGIHWHVSKKHSLRYHATDRKREDVDWIELTEDDGTRRVWTRPGRPIDEEKLDPRQLRDMDCVDCHNRPTHIFLSPQEALDGAMADDQIDGTVPWMRRLCEEVLTPDYATQEEAMTSLGRLPVLYQERYPELWKEHREKVEAAVPVLQEIHRTFVYPDMKIRWNTYNSLISHPTPHTSGCFRCHDGILRDEEGRTITMECDACHFILANHERDPQVLKILEDL